MRGVFTVNGLFPAGHSVYYTLCNWVLHRTHCTRVELGTAAKHLTTNGVGVCGFKKLQLSTTRVKYTLTKPLVLKAVLYTPKLLGNPSIFSSHTQILFFIHSYSTPQYSTYLPLDLDWLCPCLCFSAWCHTHTRASFI